MVRNYGSNRRTILKLIASGSGAGLGGIAISGSAAADSRDLKRSLIPDVKVKNTDEVERTFELSVYNTSGQAEQMVFSESVTAAVWEIININNVIPRGKESRLNVRLDDGRTASVHATIVGANPNRYGIEVRATTEVVGAYPRHIDPGPTDFVGGGE